MSEKINKANSLMGIIRRTFDHMDEQFFLQFLSLLSAHISNMLIKYGLHT